MLDSLLGGATGAGVGGYLGSQSRGPGFMDLLAPLDYPRQALANLGRGIYRGVSGEGTWDDLLGALPGAAGVLGGALTGGVGGILAGSLLGGALQGGGKLSGRGAFDAPETSQLLEALGGDPEDFLQNMALGVATDPLTYAGMGPGARVGRNMVRGQGAGKGVSLYSGLPPSLLGEGEWTGSLRPLVESGSAESKILTGMVDAQGNPLTHRPSQAHLDAWRKAIGPRAPAQEYAGATPQLRLGQGYETNPVNRSARQSALGAELESLPLSGQTATFPHNLTPEQFNEQLNKLYNVARDFEGDLAHGGLSINPTDALKQQHTMWDEILRAEHEFGQRADRAQFYPDLLATGVAPDARLSHLGDYRDPASRTFTPEIAQQFRERWAQAVGERSVAQFIEDPALRDLIAAASGGRIEHGQQVSPFLGSLSEMADRASGMRLSELTALHDAAYSKHGQPAILLSQGRMPPEQAQATVAQLMQKGYPINQESLLKHYQEANKLAMADVPDMLDELTTIIRRAGRFDNPDQGLTNYHAVDTIERLTQLLGPEKAAEAIEQAKLIARGGI